MIELRGEEAALGAFGFSWQEKLAKAMGLKFTVLNASIAGHYVDKLHAAYKTAILKEKYPVQNAGALSKYISSTTKETSDKVDNFLVQLKRLAQAGEIPYGAYEPTQSAPLKALSFGKSLLNKGIFAGAAVLAAYLLIPKLLTMKKGS